MQLIRQQLIEELLSALLKNVKDGNCNLSDEAAEEAVAAITAINNLSTVGGGNFAYAVCECDESFSSELETIYF